MQPTGQAFLKRPKRLFGLADDLNFKSKPSPAIIDNDSKLTCFNLYN